MLENVCVKRFSQRPSIFREYVKQNRLTGENTLKSTQSICAQWVCTRQLARHVFTFAIHNRDACAYLCLCPLLNDIKIYACAIFSEIFRP